MDMHEKGVFGFPLFFGIFFNSDIKDLIVPFKSYFYGFRCSATGTFFTFFHFSIISFSLSLLDTREIVRKLRAEKKARV